MSALGKKCVGGTPFPSASVHWDILKKNPHDITTFPTVRGDWHYMNWCFYPSWFESWLTWFPAGECCQDLEVLRPFHPYYVKEGGNLTLECQCSHRNFELEWVRQTPSTNYEDVQIVPTEDNDFVIRTLTEEPTGFMQSTLIKKDVGTDDKGTYLCQDVGRESAFGVWVTVLKGNFTWKYIL